MTRGVYTHVPSEGPKNAKIILHLCADVGTDSKPYKDMGYDVRLIGSDMGVENYSPLDNVNVYGIIANPVCTEFSVAQGFDKFCNYEEGLFLVRECLRIIVACSPKFWVIENPASGRLKKVIGAPQMTYEPWEFGSPWTKKTGLWGIFNKPKKVYTKWEDVPKNSKLYIRPKRPKPSIAFLHKSAQNDIEEFSCFPQAVNDMSFRSFCPQTFAWAFFMVNQ